VVFLQVDDDDQEKNKKQKLTISANVPLCARQFIKELDDVEAKNTTFDCTQSMSLFVKI
jgi:hypothetical protein